MVDIILKSILNFQLTIRFLRILYTRYFLKKSSNIDFVNYIKIYTCIYILKSMVVFEPLQQFMYLDAVLGSFLAASWLEKPG